MNYQFTDLSLLESALTHRSAGKTNNERQEFLGDAILGFLIADELCGRFPDYDEGQLSRLRASLVKRHSLAELARRLDLGEYLRLGAGELRSGGQHRDSILSDALEAVFAAIYQDGGLDALRQVIVPLFAGQFQKLAEATNLKDPKTRLQEFLQGKGHDLPLYEVIDVSGEQHAQSFAVKCAIESLRQSRVGRGSSRKQAEQDAARQLLEILEDG